MILSKPIFNALAGSTTITNYLTSYVVGTTPSWPIFTRRPAPAAAPFPLIMISSDITVTDEDGINYSVPVFVRDIIVTGQNDTPDHFRAVEALAWKVRLLFHRQRVLTVPDWNLVDIVARGPIAAPTDGSNEQLVARAVSLTIRLSSI